MSEFKKNLEFLPSVEGIERLELFEEGNSQPVLAIENKPGKAGSVAVYHAIEKEYGRLDHESANAGLEIFAEHVISAAKTPGAHPNIDFLFRVIENDQVLSIKIIEK